MTKKKLLLVWWYERKDLFKVFEQMSDLFDYELIFKKFPEEETSSVPYTKYYWADFRSAFQLLKKSSPDVVVFLGIDSNYSIALNSACKHRCIPTIYLEHGLRYPLDYTIKHDKAIGIEKKMVLDIFDKSKLYNRKKLHSLIFFLRSLRIGDIKYSGKIAQHLFLYGRKSIFYVLKVCRLPMRQADHYINYSAFNAEYITEADSVPPKKMHLIGNPAWDNFFVKTEYANPFSDNRAFYLLIDTPWYSGDVPGYDIGETGRAEFYGKLLSYAKARNANLVVKLHPLDYKRPGLPHADGIVYLEDADIMPYVTHGSGCFGTPSTMMLPMVYLQPCILFRYFEEPIADVLKEMDIITILNVRNFAVEDIVFNTFPLPPAKKQQYVEKLLYKADGKAMERLRRTMSDLIYPEKIWQAASI